MYKEKSKWKSLASGKRANETEREREREGPVSATSAPRRATELPDEAHQNAFSYTSALQRSALAHQDVPLVWAMQLRVLNKNRNHSISWLREG